MACALFLLQDYKYVPPLIYSSSQQLIPHDLIKTHSPLFLHSLSLSTTDIQVNEAAAKLFKHRHAAPIKAKNGASLTENTSGR